ncbi:MAG: hypothetical protein V4587_04680 [Acidobacteriota bacterium]
MNEPTVESKIDGTHERAFEQAHERLEHAALGREGGHHNRRAAIIIAVMADGARSLWDWLLPFTGFTAFLHSSLCF